MVLVRETKWLLVCETGDYCEIDDEWVIVIRMIMRVI